MTLPRWIRTATGVALLALAAPGGAQILPPLPPVGPVIDRATDSLPVASALRGAQALARVPIDRARDLVRQHPDRIALDPDGNAVRAHELIVMDADPALIGAAARQGFALIEQVRLDELGIGYARFRTPAGASLKRALKRMRGIAGDRDVSTDPLHFASGATGAATVPAITAPAPGGTGTGGAIGIIDGGVAPTTPGLTAQKGFAAGGIRAHDHAAAIASILSGGAGVRASAPGARLYVADVYGGDPAGGNASAIGLALAWLTRERVPVVVVSLVGPPNPLLGRIVAAARRTGTVVVAAVGNDGPAAPPAYPASYPQVIAVTGVDARGRALIEAGRATRLDYAAPGADLVASDARGQPRTVRGTSFAAPFVAARLSAHLGGGIDAALRDLDGEARDLGRRGRDPAFGRGLICGDCATRPR
ncbi:S8 family serine peptidase [Sphingomonas sp.]|uniref:S8 family serine peptidase n=1 Tax=Sphingomonas sp. TaxID=28214 RepID=UPI001ECA62FC|nr:S8 family serine peptidase [Sphingomonas sp.]MBX3595739.1 S8 family serine peptidase [Sphingomonas sp.]